MNESQRFCFVTPNWGRSITDTGWESIDPLHIKLWKEAVAQLAMRNVVTRNRHYVIKADWSNLLRAHEHSYAALKYMFSNETTESLDERIKRAGFPSRAIRSNITISTNEKGKSGAHLLENFIHDVFLIMNLAAPGSCDFHGASIKGDKFSEVSLSNYHFDAGLATFLEKRWPIFRVLELESVIRWYYAVREGVSQLPQNLMARVLFALLHLARGSVSSMSVIWLFYAFESLLQTRVGENFSAIVRRASLLLEPDKQQAEQLRKGMRSLYEIRNAIVHGGFEVIHPLHNDILDERVNDSYHALIVAADFGHAVLVSCIQKIIERNWRFAKFDETVIGDVIK